MNSSIQDMLTIHFSAIPEGLIEQLKLTANEIGIKKIAIVGGVIRDLMIRNSHQENIVATKDLDICLEGSAYQFAKHLEVKLGKRRVSITRVNKSYSTVEMQIDNLLIDIATARIEIYPSPGLNPQIRMAKLEEDLPRRDFTVNAMALDLTTNNLIDLYQGRDAINNRQLQFIHSKSVEEDPTRIVRCARYAARLNFQITSESLKQITTTIEQWPWDTEENEVKMPPALSTRLRMELECLLENEPWEKALQYLQEWGGLRLLDDYLQRDLDWRTRLKWGHRLNIQPLTALIAGSSESVSLARRLQLPHQQQKLLSTSIELQQFFSGIYKTKENLNWKPSEWCEAIENHKWHPDAVAIAICLQHPLWKYFLTWLQDWKNVQSPISAKELMNQGWVPGPLLREELKRLRKKSLDSLH